MSELRTKNNMSENPVSENWWDAFWSSGDVLVKVGALALLYLGTQAWEKKAFSKSDRTHKRRRPTRAVTSKRS
jgi:hypothetical protein